jgi:hypothetical protein
VKRIVYIVSIDFSDEAEGAAAEAELLDAVAVLGALYLVRTEANYDRTIEILRSKGEDEGACIIQVPSTE